MNKDFDTNSLFLRGATITGTFSLEDSEIELTQKQQDALRDEIKKFHSDANNTDTTFLASKIKGDLL